MRFGFRKPSIRKRIGSRTSVKRIIRHSIGVKAPRGMGGFTNPKKAIYNRVYNKTTTGCGCMLLFLPLVGGTVLLTVITIWNLLT
jgi:hypothetical protein